MSKQLQSTIQTGELTLADWLSIAGVRDDSEFWGFYAWIENSVNLNELTQEDIQAIADRLDRSASWVKRSIEEHGWGSIARTEDRN